MDGNEEQKIKAIDLDGAFDKRIAEYMQKKKGKLTEEEWEDAVSALYRKFSHTRIEALNATPDEYYRNMTPFRLFAEVRERFLRDVPVDGFLRAAIEEQKEVLLALAGGDEREADFAAELLSDEERFFPAYFTLLTETPSEKLKDRIVEIFKEHADEAADGLLALFREGKEVERVADVLCRCSLREEIFDALIKVFVNGENAGAGAERLALYGDARAIPYIKEKMTYVGYADWRELKYALETLGGKAEARDFSSDKDFLTMQRAREEEAAGETKPRN